MHSRRVTFLALLLAIPALTQEPRVYNNKIWTNPGVTLAPAPVFNQQALRALAIEKDAGQLVAVQSALQSELQQLQKGLLPRDLSNNLKKAEKLSKKLRQEVSAVSGP